MNLKKYMSVGHVVEDLNQHGRFLPSKPGMIPRFDKRRLGAARTQVNGPRHIVFSSKSCARGSGQSFSPKTHGDTQPSGAHRKVAFPGDGGEETSRKSRTRLGVFKRAHAGGHLFQKEDGNAYQPDLFEKIIPIDLGKEYAGVFEPAIERRLPVEQVAHELVPPNISFWRRCKKIVSSWLRRG
jgi:hypothetical protein